jgi:hypothetical protein
VNSPWPAGAVSTGAHWNKRDIGHPHHSVRRPRRQRRLAAVSDDPCDRRLIGPAWSKRGSRPAKKLTAPGETNSVVGRLAHELAVKAEVNGRWLTGGGARLARGQLRRSACGEMASSSAG